MRKIEYHKSMNNEKEIERIMQYENPDVFLKWFNEIEGCHYLEHESIDLYGFKFFGTPYIPVLKDMAFSRNDERRQKLFGEIPSDTDILISHTAPKNILDSFENEPFDSNIRYGCQIIKNEILNRIKPTYHIFGHIHEGYG